MTNNLTKVAQAAIPVTSTSGMVTKQDLIIAAWTKGALKFLLRKHQYPIYDAVWECILDKDPTHVSHVVSCARQFGKSFTEMVVAVEYCIRNPKSTVLFVAPLKSQAKEIINGGTYFTIFETCPLSLRPTIDNDVFVFPNGSRIRLGGTDNRNYENLRGGAAHLLILDEAGFMANLEDGVIPALQPMLDSTNGKTIYSSTPPPTLDHPYVDIYRHHRDIGHISSFTIYDNSSKSPEDLKKVHAETGSTPEKFSTRFRREYLCEFVTEDSVLIARDWNDEFIGEPEPSEYDRMWHRYITLDPGVVDMTAVLFGYYNHIERQLVIEDEIMINGPDLNTQLLAGLIKDRRDGLWGDIKVYRHIADNNNLHLIQDISKLYGLPFYGTTKTRLETKGNQAEGMVNKLNTWLREGRILINPRCEILIGSLKYGTWQTTGTTRQFARSKKYGHFDALAALVYMVRNVDVYTNPIPHLYKFNPETMYLNGPKTAAPSMELNTLALALQPKTRNRL
jgi:hypothetical protein